MKRKPRWIGVYLYHLNICGADTRRRYKTDKRTYLASLAPTHIELVVVEPGLQRAHHGILCERPAQVDEVVYVAPRARRTPAARTPPAGLCKRGQGVNILASPVNGSVKDNNVVG